MATNTSRINGARPVKHLNGSPYNGQCNIYEVPAGETAPVFKGDFVIMSNSDASDVYNAVEVVAGSGEVTTGVLIVGVVVGFVNDFSTNRDLPIYSKGSAKRLVYVADSPDLVFEIQDGGTVPCTMALIGSNTGIQATAGSTVTGNSKMTTGATAPSTSNALPLKIYGVVNSPDNNFATAGVANQKLLVLINTHYWQAPATAAS